MFGFHRENVQARELASNQGITEDALDDTIYRPRFPCTSLFPAAGAALNFFGPAAYLAFPKAGTPAGRFSLPAPAAFWRQGSLTVRLIWSGDTASAVTNVQWQTNLTLTALGAAPAAITGPAPAVPGPAAANALQDYTFSADGFWPVTSAVISVGVNIFRNGGVAADTYIGEARLFGFQIIYTPSGGH